MSPDRVYWHFCMGARALEVIGERWTLLIVRDPLLGPLRFTDLERGLNEITPTRLTARLRLLESEGIITRDSSQAGREVWYSLTEAGRDLEPVVEALILWGMRHTLERPVAGEPVHPAPIHGRRRRRGNGRGCLQRPSSDRLSPARPSPRSLLLGRHPVGSGRWSPGSSAPGRHGSHGSAFPREPARR